MNRFSLWSSSSLIGRTILVILSVHLVLGACVHGYWMSSSNEVVLHLYFDYLGVPVFLLFGAIQVIFTMQVFRAFSSHQPLGSAWQYLTLSSVCTFVGIIFKHLLSLDRAINPLIFLAGGVTDHTRMFFSNVGTVVGGPIQMVLLGTGLYMAIRAYRQFGMLSRLNTLDKGLVGGSLLYSAVVICGVTMAFKNHPDRITVERALTWPGDCLLSLLLLEAVFLRRAALDMGRGYLSKVWGAFSPGFSLLVSAA